MQLRKTQALDVIFESFKLFSRLSLQGLWSDLIRHRWKIDTPACMRFIIWVKIRLLHLPRLSSFWTFSVGQTRYDNRTNPKNHLDLRPLFSLLGSFRYLEINSDDLPDLTNSLVSFVYQGICEHVMRKVWIACIDVQLDVGLCLSR